MLVDSHEVTLAGMVQVLGRATDIEVVGAVQSGEAAIDLLEDAAPDVVLISDRLHRMRGSAACAQITQQRPATAVIVLSIEPTDEAVAAYLLAGARAFLTRSVQLADLTIAVRGAAHGVCFLAPDVADRVIRWATRAIEVHEVGVWLSPAETEILTLVERGLSNRTIARQTRASESTVKSHISAIMRKLGATGRADALTIAIRRGLIPAGGEPAAGTARRTVRPAPAIRAARAPVERRPRPLVQPLRVFVVDHREVVREGLMAVLGRGTGITIAGEAGSPEDALDAFPAVDPDVVLVDFRMPAPGVVALCRSIAEARLRAQVLVLSAPPSPDQVRQVLMAGGRACLVGDVSAIELERAVLTSAHGGPTAWPVVGWADLKDLERREPRERGARREVLQQVEVQVLRLLSEGRTNRQIAEVLALSSENVKRHVHAIYGKLGVRTRAEAAGAAMRHRLI